MYRRQNMLAVADSGPGGRTTGTSATVIMNIRSHPSTISANRFWQETLQVGLLAFPVRFAFPPLAVACPKRVEVGITAAGPLRLFTGFPVMALRPPGGHLDNVWKLSQHWRDRKHVSVVITRPIQVNPSGYRGRHPHCSVYTNGCPAHQVPAIPRSVDERFLCPCV